MNTYEWNLRTQAEKIIILKHLESSFCHGCVSPRTLGLAIISSNFKTNLFTKDIMASIIMVLFYNMSWIYCCLFTYQCIYWRFSESFISQQDLVEMPMGSILCFFHFIVSSLLSDLLSLWQIYFPLNCWFCRSCLKSLCKGQLGKTVITSQRILQWNIKTTARGAKCINDSDPLPHKTTPFI